MVLGEILEQAGKIAGGTLNSIATNFDEIAGGIAKTEMRNTAPEFAKNFINFGVDDLSNQAAKNAYGGMVNAMEDVLGSAKGMDDDVISGVFGAIEDAARGNKEIKSKLSSYLTDKEGFGEVMGYALNVDTTGYASNMAAYGGDSAAKSAIVKGLKKDLSGDNWSKKGRAIGDMMQSYYMSGGLKQNAIRIGATYSGASLAHRVLSGGTLTHKNTGERDIGGIPFI